MDSINQQQSEENRRDLNDQAAIEKIKELAKKAESCFFCTSIRSGSPFETRPMSPQKIDDSGIFWFLSASDSHKNAEIQNDEKVQLLFQGGPHSDFLNLYGKASISADQALIKELWDPILKVWFTEGIDDPRITVIRFEPEEGYYWDTKHGTAVAFIKQLAGAAIGKTIDDSIEGEIKV